MAGVHGAVRDTRLLSQFPSEAARLVLCLQLFSGLARLLPFLFAVVLRWLEPRS